MEFLKRNYVRIIIATVMLVGSIVFVVLLAKYDSSYHNLDGDFRSANDPKNGLGNLFTYIATMLFFLLSMVVVIMTMFEKTKKFSKWATCFVGVIGIALMSAAIICGLTSESSKYAKEIMAGDYDAVITAKVETQAGPLVKASIAANILDEHGVDISSYDVEAWSSLPGALEPVGQGAYAAYTAKIAELSAQPIDTAKKTASYQYFSGVASFISQLVIFGLLPLCFGIKKALRKNQ